MLKDTRITLFLLAVEGGNWHPGSFEGGQGQAAV